MKVSLVLCGALIALCATAQTPAAGSAPADAPAQSSAAAAPAPPPPDPPKLDGWVFSGMADGYFTLNFNHPMSNSNQLQNFDINWGQPEMSLAKFTVDKSDKILGIHLDAGLGETMRLIHASDPQPKGFSYIEQMYVILKPNHMHGAEFDFGQFVTSAGAEVIESSSNWNYSRSLLFAWAIPYYHFGLRSSVPVTKTLTVGVQVVNAWNNLWGNNTMKNLGFTAVYTKPKYTLNANYYVGPNNPGTTQGKRNLFDTTLVVNPTSKASLYVNYDYGHNNAPLSGPSASWYGIAGAFRYQLSKRFAISPRIEWFDDANGFSTGTVQKIKEGTITGEYKYNDHLLARLEFRRDVSDKAFFDRGAQTATAKSMNTATLGLVFLLGPLK
jgi:hypothetical protein